MIRTAIIVVVLVATASSRVEAEPISYQGQLAENGQPAEGLFDFLFSLYDSETDGTQVSIQVQRFAVQVSDGLFSVDLDFGDESFTEPRWLRISVKKRPSGGFVSLSPRQRIRSTPSAVAHTRAPWTENGAALVAGDGAEQLVINRDTPTNGFTNLTLGTPAGDAQFGGMYIEGDHPSARPFYGYFNPGSVTAYHYLDGPSGELRVNNGGDHIEIERDGDTRVSGVVTAQSFVYEEPSNRFLRLDYASFVPARDTDYLMSGGTAHLEGPNGLSAFIAGVSLPLGAEILNLRFFFKDDSPTTDLFCRLTRSSNSGEREIMAEVYTNGSDQFDVQSASTSNILFPVVNPLTHSYRLGIFATDGWQGFPTGFHSVLITYRVSQPD